ncbi:MAG: hypothetical protein IIT98_05155 [Kiritimatiellae bacterium]|nr:hypothetical protein [Kiritimatiellia bacterium]
MAENWIETVRCVDGWRRLFSPTGLVSSSLKLRRWILQFSGNCGCAKVLDFSLKKE